MYLLNVADLRFIIKMHKTWLSTCSSSRELSHKINVLLRLRKYFLKSPKLPHEIMDLPNFASYRFPYLVKFTLNKLTVTTKYIHVIT